MQQRTDSNQELNDEAPDSIYKLYNIIYIQTNKTLGQVSF